MTDEEEVQAVRLAETVQAARKDLHSHLSISEGKTRRRWGSDHARTFEDTALAISVSDDERAPAVAIALGNFQAALNRLWRHVLDIDVPDKLLNGWMRSRARPILKVGADYNSAKAEVSWLLRDLLTRWRPDMGAMHSYINLPIYRGLDNWLARQSLPVELSERAARQSPEDLIEMRDEWEERRHHDGHIEDHMLDALDRAADGILNDDEEMR